MDIIYGSSVLTPKLPGFKIKDLAAFDTCFQDIITGNLTVPDDMTVDKCVGELTRVILRV
jgi:hypothetical protein